MTIFLHSLLTNIHKIGIFYSIFENKSEEKNISELIGMSAMEIFDETVKSLTDHGLIVILNNHIR